MSKTPPRFLPALRLLGQVLTQARADLDRSPEEIGRLVGISGRTIRRIEAGTLTSPPRPITLEALAEHYGLNASFLKRLAAQGGRGQDLLEAELRAEATDILSELAPADEPGALLRIAMRLARHGPTADRMMASRHHAGEDEVAAVVRDFVRLDRPRRELVRSLIHDLLAARRHEQRSHAGEAS